MAKSTPKSQKKDVKLSKNQASAKSAPKKIIKTIIKAVSKKIAEKTPVKKGEVAKKASAAAVVAAPKSVIKTITKSSSHPVKVITKKAGLDSKTPEKGPLKKTSLEKDKSSAKVSSTAAENSDSGRAGNATNKIVAKATSKKKSTDKKDEFAIEDDLVGETEDFVSDELSEYQAELENAVEEMEEKDIPVEEPPLAASTAPSYKDKGGDIVLTDAEGRRYCRVKDCDQVEAVDAYCRYHYLLLWKKIQVRKKILTDGKLERYVEELTSRYPDKFLEVIRRDLRTEKDFVSAIQEMEIDESSSDNDFEDESSNYIDEVRSASSESLVEDDEY